MGPKFVILDKKYFLGIAALVVLVLIVLAAVAMFRNKGPELTPEVMIEKAFQNTRAVNSFRYRTESRLTVNNNKELLSKVEGEKSGPENVHIKGTMLKSSIELYQIGDVTYTKDSFTNRWIVLKGNTLQQQQLFMTELNPLANFDYKEVFDIKYEGAEKVGRDQTWVYSFHPRMVSPFIEMFWSDVTFKIWVDQDKIVIRKACITGKSKKDSRDTLQAMVELYDYDKKIEIQAPKVKPLGQP